MNKAESKFYNTTKKMIKGLFNLLEKKNFADISVSEICKEAGINRSTFYSHYDNTYQLLQEARNHVLKEFANSFEESTKNIDFEKNGVEVFMSQQFIIPYLKFVKKNKKIFKIFVNNLSTFNTEEFYQLLLKKIWIPSCNQKGIYDLTIINYMSRFYLNGMTAIVLEWINSNCEDDILFMCELIILCVRPNKDIKVNL